MRILVFPGQGSQYVGMGKTLADADRAARDVFEEVDEALGCHLSQVMWEGPSELLTLTENAQPALMAASMAVVRILETNGYGVKSMADYVAGHSLGEYTALAAAGSFSLSDTARLLQKRGQAMQRAVPIGEGSMAAIMGLSFDTVAALAQEASGDDICVAANDNANGQTVISGHTSAVERAIMLAKEQGAKRAVTLPVSAPFHSPLMAPAAEEMDVALSSVTIETPAVPVIANVTARPVCEPENIHQLLVDQVTAPVRWRETMDSFQDLGITEVVEIGAGKVLTGLMRRADRSMQIYNIETPDHIDAFLKG